jgi:DNA polymerase III alpha subunit
VPDIDIDFADRTKALDVIKHIPAAIVDKDGAFKKHNTGVYCHSIPYNPLTGTASIDYKAAEERGYFKVDFLNVGVYQGVRDDEHLTQLLNTEPLWDLLTEDEFTNNLFHVNGHGSILRKMKPTSIEELAMVLAVIRPAKRHLIGLDWVEVKKEVWQRPAGDEYYFKKSHAHSYAALVVIHMNMLCEKLTTTLSSSYQLN